MEKKIFTVTYLILAGCSALFSQTTEKIDNSIGESYIMPVVLGLNAGMNNGWFNTSPASNLAGINVEFSVIGAGTFLKDHHKTFSSTEKMKLSDGSLDKIVAYLDPSIRSIVKDTLRNREMLIDVYGPTLFGSRNESINLHYAGEVITIMHDNVAQQVNVSALNIETEVRGLSIPVVPLAAMQLTLGTVAGTKASVRWLPPIKISDEAGYIKSLGFSIFHNPMAWFTKKPALDISLGITYNSLKIGSMIKSESNMFSLYASKKIGSKMVRIEPYIGGSMNNIRTSFNYGFRYEDASGNEFVEKVSVDSQQKNIFRMTIGAAAKLGVIQLSFDYNFSKLHSISGSFGFGF